MTPPFLDVKPSFFYIFNKVIKSYFTGVLLGSLIKCYVIVSFRLSQITKPELIQKQFFLIILVNFSNFSTKFTETVANHVAKALFSFERQLEIIIPQ